MHKFGLASNLLRGKLLGQEKYSCNNQFIVLCVETAVTSAEEGNHFRSKREENDDSEADEDTKWMN